MLEGVDLEDCPEWVAECEATLDSLDEIGPGQRVYWLSVPLGVDKPSDRALEPLKRRHFRPARPPRPAPRPHPGRGRRAPPGPGRAR